MAKASKRDLASKKGNHPELQGPNGQNHLFVIAIDKYNHCPELYNCVSDAEAFVKVLTERYEFTTDHTIVLFNEEATRAKIHSTLRSLKDVVKPEDNLVIYFSGHGEVDGEVGYLVPVEAQPDNDWEFIGHSALKDRLDVINSFHTFMIIDACFAGSFFTNYRSLKIGYEARRSRLGLAASHSRERALDGRPGENSPFSKSLIKRLRENMKPLGVQRLATDVIEEVQATSQGQQTPVFKPLNLKGDDAGQFVFNLKLDEKRDWAITQKSGTAAAFESFLRTYPNGRFAKEASALLEKIKAEEQDNTAAWIPAKKVVSNINPYLLALLLAVIVGSTYWIFSQGNSADPDGPEIVALVELPSLIGNYNAERYAQYLKNYGVHTIIKERVFDPRLGENTILYLFVKGEKVTDDDLRTGEVFVAPGDTIEMVITERSTGLESE